MGNFSGGGGGRGGSGAEVDSNMGIDRGGNDNDNDFFTGTFDDPGEPGFSGPSYPGQTGVDSDGDFYSASDVGAPTDDYIPGWSVLGYPGPSYDQPRDMFDVVGNYYSNVMGMGLPESRGDSSEGLAPPSPGSGNLPTSYITDTGIPVTDYSMTRDMIETGYRTVGFQGLMEPAKIGPKAAIDFPEEYYTSTFLSREKQLRASKRMTDVEAQAYADYLGLSVEIEKREEITGNVVERALETVARSFADQISARFGAPAATPYVAGLQADYLGKVTDDYALTDFIGNVIGMQVPGGGAVDTALSEDITGRGMGDRISQIGTTMFGDSSVIGTPQEIEQMWADARAEADAERARGGDGPTVTTTFSPVGAALARPRSRLLRSFLGVAGPRIYPLFYREGGVVQKKAVGGETLDQQMQGAMQEPASGAGPTGFVGDRPENLSEAKTVADDVPLEVEEGTFIINAAAVEFAGSEDIKQMILNAIYEARAQGVDISGDENKIERERAVSLLVSEGEVVVPPLLAKIIGYDKLNKINNRGKKEVENRVQENGQSPEAEALDEQPANPSEGAAMADGGNTSSDSKIDLSDVQNYRTFKNPQASFLNMFETLGAGATFSLEDMEKAVSYSQQYRQKNNTDDSYEDTMRHTLLGGLYNPVAGTYADLKEGFHKYVEGYGKIGYEKAKELLTDQTADPEQIDIARSIIKESEIDLNNNVFGRELRRQIPDEAEYVRAVESIMDIARTEGIEEVPSITTEDGETLRLQLSTANKKQKMAPGGFVSVEGQGSTGETDSSAYKQANVAATYEGDGFVLRPRAN